MAGSPAIDAGDRASPPDPGGGPADMGAEVFDAAWTHVLMGACLPLAAPRGVPSLSGPGDFSVAATGVPPSKPGLLVHGFAPARLPIQTGILCIAPPPKRFPPQVSTPGSGLVERRWVPVAPAQPQGVAPRSRGRTGLAP